MFRASKVGECYLFGFNRVEKWVLKDVGGRWLYLDKGLGVDPGGSLQQLGQLPVHRVRGVGEVGEPVLRLKIFGPRCAIGRIFEAREAELKH